MDLFTLENLITLLMLTALQAVLGFDNLLYISLESKRAPVADQARVRKLGIGIAVALRLILMGLLVSLIGFFKDPLFGFNNKFVSGEFNLYAIIVLIGGAFILYTATKEIMHMMRIDHGSAHATKQASAGKIIFWIVLMNLVFSFDSILSAIALASPVLEDGTKGAIVLWSSEFFVMAIAIIIGGILMIALADKVSEFLQKNRMYEVLGLFVLFVVGIMLVTEGGHLAHLKLYGNEVHAMTKTTFYFVIMVLLFTDIVQGRYQKKLIAKTAPQ